MEGVMSHRTLTVVRALLLASAAAAAACGGTTPTQPAVPTPLSRTASSGGGSVSVTWSCLTAAQAGMFASAPECPSSSIQLFRPGAALTAPGGATNLAPSVAGTTVT